ncbi:hypothetical protein PNP85_06380 [Halobacterium salinarum]|uniref:hypothetical protein n=1 Tax=Halobacterium TaxID=2239 RepID=UPI001963883B|nr:MULTISPECIES: hypothetical protein [Halobacterium]MCF2164558.1 hypothetical protein [Halobacterium salinarum]MCF2166995.1 hypothetical protein [Halobacterium salinarum]MDL0139128.1 hypothetical protein [Halobacterium salinarum]QRY22668.1 hypothetical protein JT689_11785 [Halobacterium sp. GSL-19]WJK63987.1 hypothetical protein QSJ49_02090 [Halobacterium salinarum]
MTVTDRGLLIAVAGGVLNLAVMTLHSQPIIATAAADQSGGLGVLGIWALVLVGPWLLGAIPTHMYADHGAVCPLLATGVLTGACLWNGITAPPSESLTSLYYEAWPFFLVVLVVAGIAERCLRTGHAMDSNRSSQE